MVETIQKAQDRPWFFDVFACHPYPYPSECLSSYLLRLAESNGFVTFWDLVVDLFPVFAHRTQIAVLRWEYPVDGWGLIPVRTQLSMADLRRLTVLPWVEKFRSPPVVTRANQQSPGHFLRGIVNPQLRVCPLCLREQPYLRLMWRLAPVEVCLDHGCLLQTQCHRCRTPLTVLGSRHRHLRCAICDADLRTLSADMAPDEVLTVQQRRQADMKALLDPDVKLVTDPTCGLSRALGLKFRYLRSQTGQTAYAMSSHMGVRLQACTSLEVGKPMTLAFYLSYLEALSVSWPDFAALEVPEEFVQSLAQPNLLHLRLCPTPDCPNHQPPPSVRVAVLEDAPDRRMAVLRCSACGQRFTRTYEGELIIPSPRPPVQFGSPVCSTKTPEEIARLVEMGMEGIGNRQIAAEMHWTPKTVRMHWVFLGLVDQVRQAQARRRTRKKQELETLLGERVESILLSLVREDQEITLHHVTRALGRHSGYLRQFPDLKARVLEMASTHNPQVKQRRYEALSARIVQAVDEAKKGRIPMTVLDIVLQAGIRYEKAYCSYPDLLAVVREAVAEYEARMRVSRSEARCAKIDAAAAHLVAQGIILTQKAILEEAGMVRNNLKCDPIAQAQVRRWVDDFFPSE